MGRSVDGEIRYGFFLKSEDYGLNDAFKELDYEKTEEKFELSYEETQNYGLEVCYAGHTDHAGHYLVVCLEDEEHIWAWDGSGAINFKPEQLLVERTAQWDQLFKVFCEDKGLPFVQPSYLLMAKYG